MCDGALRTKCSPHLYFDSRQCPEVSGNNWMNNTLHPYENLTCTGKACDCGERWVRARA